VVHESDPCRDFEGLGRPGHCRRIRRDRCDLRTISLIGSLDRRPLQSLKTIQKRKVLGADGAEKSQERMGRSEVPLPGTVRPADIASMGRLECGGISGGSLSIQPTGLVVGVW
jgi:hypothetical protein